MNSALRLTLPRSRSPPRWLRQRKLLPRRSKECGFKRFLSKSRTQTRKYNLCYYRYYKNSNNVLLLLLRSPHSPLRPSLSHSRTRSQQIIRRCSLSQHSSAAMLLPASGIGIRRPFHGVHQHGADINPIRDLPHRPSKCSSLSCLLMCSPLKQPHNSVHPSSGDHPSCCSSLSESLSACHSQPQRLQSCPGVAHLAAASRRCTESCAHPMQRLVKAARPGCGPRRTAHCYPLLC